MGKGLDKFLNIMRLNDDNYDEDYDDEFSEDYNDYVEDYDDYDDEPEEPVVPKKKKTSSFSNRKPASSPAPEPARDYSSSASAGTSSRTSSSRSKIVPMKQPSSRSAGMEVSIQKPSSFEDSSEICDELLNGKAAIVNLEGIDVDVAQRIIDFVSGACYAMSGNIRKVSSYIFIVTPAGIDISGDMENVLTGGASKVDMSAFRLNV
ncbi:MAG TPA: cell division protein SepF [Candidatus Scybalocola faecigallinarum]|mgnify:CR=1 FL=1|uniref:Cell division protein SepF n=1 Tax=Candidatus Scybalocola faecigallinarum TaxID=2840941 RepID=A0A9D1JRP0_9FIRM|nr:cell division protein SepF [Candidatus Scybalocola faecigallinarum]